MMRVRTVEASRFVFGEVLWGGPRIEVPVVAASVVYSERVQCIDGTQFYVARPVYVEEPTGALIVYDLGRDGVTEEALEGPGCREAWEAYIGGVGVTERSTPT